jgi:hypothetical protein
MNLWIKALVNLWINVRRIDHFGSKAQKLLLTLPE